MRVDEQNWKDYDLAKVLQEPEVGTYLLLSQLIKAGLKVTLQKEEVLSNKKTNTALLVAMGETQGKTQDHRDKAKQMRCQLLGQVER